MLRSGPCLSTLCSLWNPTRCKTACRYPHPAGPVILTLNPLTDYFRWVRPQQQLDAATDSWFVPDFMVQERPTLLSARRITDQDKWHHACICTAVAHHSTQHTPSTFEHCLDSKQQQLTENEKKKKDQLKAIRWHCGKSLDWTDSCWRLNWFHSDYSSEFVTVFYALLVKCLYFIIALKKQLVYWFFFSDKTQKSCLSHMWVLQLLFST